MFLKHFEIKAFHQSTKMQLVEHDQSTLRKDFMKAAKLWHFKVC